ncbi:uncharacterized protein T551_02457 [Pneumocystis jirovecii RU7]|uniref:Uncharacterized protein n=1 Tax=Pneumocystis jirovecii (strain RU7) TaxID=1408657 RepID=A0A0W4ZJR5_PNEJ7|nr:uncharacterized protein T551_02457 [Pneumocystis jirovecii RU7]KTW28607.1 hypothetical protein T551_02457 [Pneumocystis jirovecii RU7]
MSKGYFGGRRSGDDMRFYPSNYYGGSAKDTFLTDKRETNMQSHGQEASFGALDNKMGWIAAFGTGGYLNEQPLLEGEVISDFGVLSGSFREESIELEFY